MRTYTRIKCFICYISIRPFDTINLHSAEDRSNVTRLYLEFGIAFLLSLALIYYTRRIACDFLSQGLSFDSRSM